VVRLSTRSSLPVVGASPVPYHPALTKRTPTCRRTTRSQTPPRGASRRRRFYVGILALVVASIAIVGALTSRDNRSASPSAIGNAAESTTTTTSAIVSTRTEVTSRLREILEIRDRALVARNAQLLSDVYTVDCECLKDGKALIQQLRKENVLWKGVKTKIDIRSAEEVDRLWIVVATVGTPSVRIETEAGRLVRTVPPEQNLVRFALAKPQIEEKWLLGHASTIE
jgi:hypothetical protein